MLWCDTWEARKALKRPQQYLLLAMHDPCKNMLLVLVDAEGGAQIVSHVDVRRHTAGRYSYISPYLDAEVEDPLSLKLAESVISV